MNFDTRGIGLAEASRRIREGGIVVYPTETFFAVGGDALNADSVRKVYEVKKRSGCKPLPVVVGDERQLDGLVTRVPSDTLELMRLFWPGPLSFLLPGKASLPEGVRDREGLVCVRLTGHPGAAALCRLADRPLTATSANFSGAPASAALDIDPALLRSVQGMVNLPPRPPGGLPSTILRRLSPLRYEIVRPGAVDAPSLAEAGISLVRSKF